MVNVMVAVELLKGGQLYGMTRTGSGWWILTGLVPILRWIALLIFYVDDSRPGANQYGPNPKGV